MEVVTPNLITHLRKTFIVNLPNPQSLGDLHEVVTHRAVNDKLSEICQNQLHILMQSQTRKQNLYKLENANELLRPVSTLLKGLIW